jgi:hypothetical protein
MKGIIFISLIVFVFFTSLISYAADSTLVLYLSLNEGSGNKVTDGSQYGNDGVINGAKWVDGKFGKALQFDGATTDVKIPASESLDLTDAYTLAAWINAGSTQTDWCRIIDKGQDPTSGYVLLLSNDRKVQTTAYTAVKCEVFGKTPVNDNNWHHVAGVYDSKKNSLFVYTDGVDETTMKMQPNSSAVVLNKFNLHLGYTEAHDGLRFNGIIDEVRIYNRALPAAEIKQMMEASSLGVDALDKLTVTWGSLKKG